MHPCWPDAPPLLSHALSARSRLTGIKTEDIISTLQALNLIKYWKGQVRAWRWLVALAKPCLAHAPPAQHVIFVSKTVLDQHLASTKRMRLCDPTKLRWTPPHLRGGTGAGDAGRES